ncbi:hypothetical protein ERO13_D02G077350v2 [Gossypium hirsutum]|uniref:Uncharacterized protein n=1 Tax=Gossypium mustelinum TaxID=34275 RepID=A0A5D2VTV4_GOSMU|nr:hypothetical protein ERO13_D02G077350v2 [Gossypium hirsutum]TYI92759.1 hypothetical protein E1A91_D02G093700v1 [Gossypium mustelinum]
MDSIIILLTSFLFFGNKLPSLCLNFISAVNINPIFGSTGFGYTFTPIASSPSKSCHLISSFGKT